jgi:hypothetical protein
MELSVQIKLANCLINPIRADEKGILISDHAKKRLKERMPELSLSELSDILLKSKFVKRRTSVIQIINSKFVEAVYLINIEKDICFVLPIEAGEIVSISTLYRATESSWIPKTMKTKILKIAKENLELKPQVKKALPTEKVLAKLESVKLTVDKNHSDSSAFINSILDCKKDIEFVVRTNIFVLNFSCADELFKLLGSGFASLPNRLTSMFINEQDNTLSDIRISIKYMLIDNKIHLTSASGSIDFDKTKLVKIKEYFSKTPELKTIPSTQRLSHEMQKMPTLRKHIIPLNLLRELLDLYNNQINPGSLDFLHGNTLEARNYFLNWKLRQMALFMRIGGRIHEDDLEFYKGNYKKLQQMEKLPIVK